MTKVRVGGPTGELKKSPDLDLRGKVGNKIVGIFKRLIQGKVYTDKYSALIEVIDTDGSTTVYDKEKGENVEVEINKGDTVFLRLSTTLLRVDQDGNLTGPFAELEPGQHIEVVYSGTKKSKTKGRKAMYLYDVYKIVPETANGNE